MKISKNHGPSLYYLPRKRETQEVRGDTGKGNEWDVLLHALKATARMTDSEAKI